MALDRHGAQGSCPDTPEGCREPAVSDPVKWREPGREEPCGCGSGKRAKSCCLNAGRWNPSPASISPKAARSGAAVAKCYARSLKDCGGEISGEHYVSAALLREVGTEKKEEIEVSGASWLKGKRLVLPVERLEANVLCKRHNEQLAPLDDVAGRYVRALKEINEAVASEGSPLFRVASGVDLERWMLKVLCGLIASGAIEAPEGREPPEGLVAALFGAAPFPKGLGFYADLAGDEGVRAGRYFRANLVFSAAGEPVALRIRAWGFPSILSIASPGSGFVYQPHRIEFVGRKAVHALALGWRGGYLLGYERVARYTFAARVTGPHPSEV